MSKESIKRDKLIMEISESYDKEQSTGSPHRLTREELKKRLGDIRNKMTSKEHALYRKSKSEKTVAEMFNPPPKKKKPKAG